MKKQTAKSHISPQKKFFLGFAIGVIPAFTITLFRGFDLSDAIFMSIVQGSLTGLLALIFGKRMLDFLISFFKEGWS